MPIILYKDGLVEKFEGFFIISNFPMICCFGIIGEWLETMILRMAGVKQ